MPSAWVLFDMNGTLLDPATIDRALGRTGSNAVAGDALVDAVTHAMALTLAGGYRPFSELLEAALSRTLGSAEDHGAEGDQGAERAAEASLGRAMDAASRLEPYPDARDALERLADAGLRTGVLTNSARATAEQNLDTVGLRDLFQAVIGTEEVEAFKPDGRVYRHAASRLGAAPAELCLVSAHDWDLLGAARAGLRTAWVSCKEREPLSTAPEPDFRGDDLVEVAEALAATDASPSR